MSRLLFAVTREDPQVEASLVPPQGSVLTICSGGCTALHLKTRYPALRVTAFDTNPRQLEHLEEKIIAASMGHIARFNVEQAGPKYLNQCGEFERLFRIFRECWLEFISTEEEINRYFSARLSYEDQSILVQKWMSSQYWMAPFYAAFNDSFLHLMFTEKATQHAGTNSYPNYFATKISEGLLRKDGPSNPFLQHILLGWYKQRNAPSYTFAKRKLNIEMVEGSLTDITDIDQYDLISLSNVLDWSDATFASTWLEHLSSMKTGAKVLIRQLNNTYDWNPIFGSRFEKIDSETLQQSERSLFYNKHSVFIRK
jgi:S-adenosylmethionine-diacylglycerol 3-amino-3-carboxypropyl transferase